MDEWLFLENNSGQTGIPSEIEFTHWVSTALHCTQNERRELSIQLVDSQTMQSINKQFRATDKPTNVLSFPFDAVVPEQSTLSWGDIVICVPLVEQEATEQGKLAKSHWAHLTVHGILHLIGYDHSEQADAAIMEPLEVSILSKLGVANPYESDEA